MNWIKDERLMRTIGNADQANCDPNKIHFLTIETIRPSQSGKRPFNPNINPPYPSHTPNHQNVTYPYQDELAKRMETDRMADDYERKLTNDKCKVLSRNIQRMPGSYMSSLVLRKHNSID